MTETCQRGRRFPRLPLVVPTSLAVGLLLIAGPGHGLGFGRPQATAVIGSPLDFTLPLQVQAGEPFDPDCVQVQVQVGDRRLPPYAVRWQVVPGARTDEQRVQVSTLAVLDEPVVTVLVSSGCQARVSRRTTLLTQLPGSAAPAPEAASADTPTPLLHRGLANSTSRPLRTAAAPRLRQSDSLRLDRLLPSAGGVAANAVGAAAVAALAVSPGLPSAAMPLPGAVVLGVQAALADAATQTATEQIRVLEQQVQQVLTEARRQQDLLAQLRQRLTAAESANAWLPWLLLPSASLYSLLLLQLHLGAGEKTEPWSCRALYLSLPVLPCTCKACRACPTCRRSGCWTHQMNFPPLHL